MHIIAEGRLMGFDAGDWSLLFCGSANFALAGLFYLIRFGAQACPR